MSTERSEGEGFVVIGEQEPRFDCRWLLVLAAAALLAAFVWWASSIALAESGELALLLDSHPLAPAWVVLAPCLIYYAHLAIRRFNVCLSAFVAIVLVWGNLTAFTWAVSGWEKGLSMALGAGVVLGFGFSWGSTAIAFLGCRTVRARVGLVLLGSLLPVAIVGVAVTAWLSVLSFRVSDWSSAAVLSFLLVVSVAEIAAVAWLSWRTRLRARTLLHP